MHHLGDFGSCIELFAGQSIEAHKEIMVLDPTLEVIAEDGEFITVRKSGESWLSWYADMPMAFQGDPRWPIAIFGKKIAAYLGYKILSDTTMTMPQPTRVIRRLNELNAKLRMYPDSIMPVNFYASDREQELYDDYLRMFAYEGKLPLSLLGTTRFHDLIFHIAVIMLPNEAVRHARLLTRAVIEFAEYLRALPRYESSKWLKKFVRMIIKQRSHDLDVSTGQFNYAMAGQRNEIAMKKYFTLLVSEGKSPYNYLMFLITSFTHEDFTAEDRRNLRAVLSGFRTSNQSWIDDSYSYSKQGSLDWLCKHVRHRLEELEAVIP